MKIDEYAIIKLIKNMHPVNLERTLDYYSRSITDNGMRRAVILAIQSKCLNDELERRLIRMFKLTR